MLQLKVTSWWCQQFFGSSFKHTDLRPEGVGHIQVESKIHAETHCNLLVMHRSSTTSTSTCIQVYVSFYTCML